MRRYLNRAFKIAALGSLCWLCTACSSDNEPSGVAAVPESKLPEVSLDVKRYELLMFQLEEAQRSGKNCAEEASKLFAGKEATLLAQWLLRGMVSPEEIDSFFVAQPQKALMDLSIELCAGIASPGNRQMHDSLRAYLPKDWDLAGRLTPLFRRFKYYFPDKPIPAIRTAVAGHDPTMSPAAFYPMDEVLLSEKWLFIGLDYFVGSKFQLIHPQIPKYIRKRFDDQYMEVRIARALTPLVQPELPQQPPQTLLAQMLHEGMKYYVIDMLLPNLPDSTKMLWSPEQLAWAQANEAAVYKKVLPELYSAKYRDFSFLLEERPFAKAGWDQAAPPRLGHYIGWRIIQRYMAANPQLSLPDLLRQNDWQRILQQSGYKPKES